MSSETFDVERTKIIADAVASAKYVTKYERNLLLGKHPGVRGILLDSLDDDLADILRTSDAADALFLTGEGMAIDRWSLCQFVEAERIRLGISRDGKLPEQSAAETAPAEAQSSNAKTVSAVAVVPPESRPLGEVSKKPCRGDHVLIEPEAIDAAFEEMKLNGQEDPKKYPRAKLLQGLREYPYRSPPKARPRHLVVLDSLRQDFPNFGEVIDWLDITLRLRIELSASLVWPPFLLHGDPGVGKTAFARAFSERMACDYTPISIAATSAIWTLRGGHRGWRDGGLGTVAATILRLKDRRGAVFLLDELDKMQDSGKNYPIEPTLLELLEPGQSDAYVDEYLGVPLDITPLATWICTANKLRSVSAPLLSRLQRFTVPLPTQAQMPAIVRSVDGEYRRRVPGIARRFLPLDDSVVNAFGVTPPRDLYAMLAESYGNALRRPREGSKRNVLVEDVQRALQRKQSSAPAEEPAQEYLAMAIVPLPRGDGGGGSAPPGTLVH